MLRNRALCDVVAAGFALGLAGCGSSDGSPGAVPASRAAPAATAAASTAWPSGPASGPALPGAQALAPPSWSSPTLRTGDQGDAVRIFQDLLGEARRREGLPPVAIDGSFGPKTRAAVQDFQRTHAVAITGQVDAATWSALHAAIAASPLGAIDPLAPPSADTYKRTGASSADVSIHALPPIEVKPGLRQAPLVAESGMAVDADGAGNAWKQDPSGQPTTSLRDAKGRSLDPTITPYFVLPIGFANHHPGVRLGDLAAVVHRGKVAYAIFGDAGPKTKLGEGSIALAKILGINPSPTSGGVGSGVFYVVFPGSGTGAPLSNAEIDARGAELLGKAGGNP